MNWDDARLVLAIARTRRLHDAGVQLGIDASTVSRRLAALEATLAVRLFARTRDGLRLTAVGTDPTVGDSAVRGTGAYRVPTLRGVGQRGLLLHDGSLPSLDAMFDPARLDASFSGGVRPGAVPGHVFGLDLSATDRAALLAYLETL